MPIPKYRNTLGRAMYDSSLLGNIKPLPNLRSQIMNRLMMNIGIILMSPRKMALGILNTTIKHIKPQSRNLGHSHDLLQQVRRVLDMPALLAHEACLDRMPERHVAVPERQRRKTLQVFEDLFLNA